ncbi:hypothetical protein, partial [Burkholderia cepacia]|uniref:hypothetical protein n=1 Tax=Burkholderia cepacia TaxID=292 RepID=UPI001E464829
MAQNYRSIENGWRPNAFCARFRPCQRSRSLTHFRRANAKTPAFWAGVSGLGSLTITYFHTGIRTIIGVESFHG